MTQARHGLILNVASRATFSADTGHGRLRCHKAFVQSFTEALWKEAGGTGLRVLALCRGATETEFVARSGEEYLTTSPGASD